MQFLSSQSPSRKTNIETPTKKYKEFNYQQPNTADSVDLTECKQHSLEDVDAQDLFERFHEIMKISEELQEENLQEFQQKVVPSVYRKLNYEACSQNKVRKLNFQPSTSSMTKRNKIQTGKCFVDQVKGKQLFKVFPVNSPCKKPIKVSDFNATNQELSSGQFVKTTPPRKMKQNMQHCQMTAKKEQPYRNIVRKN